MPIAPTTTGFLSAPTDQIAVPGLLSGGEITPEGDLYTGWAEYELRFGRRLRRWNQPTRTLPDPAVPLLSSELTDGRTLYTLTVFAIAVDGQPVAFESVTATNDSDAPAVAQVAMAVAYTRGRVIRGPHGLATTAYRYERPATGQPDGYFDQPGQRFSADFRYTTSGRDLDRSGLLLARGPAAVSSPLPTPVADTPTTAHDGRVFRSTLATHGQLTLTWQIPLAAPRAGSQVDAALDGVPLALALTELDSAWSAQESGMMQIDVPEPKVVDTYEAAIVEMLSSRYPTPLGWVQASNKLQYQSFWLRDAAEETQALDLAGLHAQAAQNLAFLCTFQESNGLFISRAGQYDGFGQALWALDEHAQLTQDPAYAAAQLARIAAAVSWLSSATAADPLGLLPASNPHDDELAYGHITGDDFWAAAGLRAAVNDATLAGRGDLASAWQAVDDTFETSLDQAVAVAVRRTGHIPPVLDSGGGEDWGNYYAAYPVQVLPASSAPVRATVAWARAHMVEGLATYFDGRTLHDFLGFAIFQTELAAGDARDAIAGLYAELAHTTSTDDGWEADVVPFGSGSSKVDLAPHGTFAAEYVALLRNLLVDDGSDGAVDLLAGASPAWLAPGQQITVTDAPTDQGVVSFTERSSADGEELTWTSDLAPGTVLTWTLPAWARDIRTADGQVAPRTLALSGSSGTTAVSFDGRRPAQSYLSAVAALNSQFQAHGRPAPLVASTR